MILSKNRFTLFGIMRGCTKPCRSLHARHESQGCRHSHRAGLHQFRPRPLAEPLAVTSVVIASRNDPFCTFEVAEDIAGAWGSLFIDAGDARHLNADACFG